MYVHTEEKWSLLLRSVPTPYQKVLCNLNGSSIDNVTPCITEYEALPPIAPIFQSTSPSCCEISRISQLTQSIPCKVPTMLGILKEQETEQFATEQ